MNKKIFTPLFVAASFLLVGCSTDTIVSRPSWIDQDIIDVGGIDDNKMKDIYDAIKELGDTNSAVLNKVMYDIAKGQLGTFEELKKYANPTTDVNEFKAFVEKHTMYQPDAYSAVKDAEGNVTTKKLEELTDIEKNTISREKIKQQHDAIVERACELMYNEVKDGSYFTDGIKKLFSESEYVRHLRKELYWPDTKDVTLKENLVFIPKSIDDPNDNTWEKHANKYLNLTDGNGNFTKVYYPTDSDVDPHHDGGYIGRKILPDVYRESLIQNYVREQRYTNLGRGYARKAKMIKIEGGENVGPVGTMLRNYAKEHITGYVNTSGTFVTPIAASLDDLNTAMIGMVGTSGESHDYLTKAKFEPIKLGADNLIWQAHVKTDGTPKAEGETISTHVYYGTKLGNIVETFMKAYDFVPSTGGAYTDYKLKSPYTDEVKNAYNDLTNNGAYPIEVGLELKERELFSTDLTQDGWFMKNGGLTDLNDTFRNDLFNITTSNIIDDKEKMTVDAEHGWGPYETGDTARYFALQDGSKHAYLLGSSTEEDPSASVVLQDTSNNFYIVEIEEAASLAKLSLEDSRSYINLKATETLTDSNKAMNEIVRSITKQVASDDTYKKNAEQYYLMISNILFYDQSVYDYFKSQFPDLFK